LLGERFGKDERNNVLTSRLGWPLLGRLGVFLENDVTMYKMNEQLMDYKDKVEGLEYTLKSHYSQQKTKLQQIASEALQTHQCTMESTFDNLLKDKLTEFQNQLTYKMNSELEAIIKGKVDDFQQQLDSVLKEMIQDVYAAADEGHKALTDYSNLLCERFHEKVNLKEPYNQNPESYQRNHFEATMCPPNSKEGQNSLRVQHQFDSREGQDLFRKHHHVDSTTPREIQKTPMPDSASTTRFSLRSSPNPYDTASPPDIPFRRSPTQNGYDVSVPTTVHAGRHILPVVNHDQALKRTKIQFTGLGDVFVFYSQLMNAMEQFGIYLIPLNQVKYQCSLCPTAVNGLRIDEHRRMLMGSTLYQKLQNTDVVPMEYTSVRNIINRFTEDNDGYKVLYAILEQVHPALQRDQVIQAPKSVECNDDIHLYAQWFDAWLRYENYANRPYSPREQVNKFISELSPVFALAVSRVRRLLDAWNPFDVIAPEVLKITNLPNTIERFMTEEMGQGQSYIRAIHPNKVKSPHRSWKPTTNETKQDGQKKYCYFCGADGHEPPECRFLAKLVKAQESLNKVDSKTKKALKERFKQDQQKQQEKRIKLQNKVIRHLVDNGGSTEEVAAMIRKLQDATANNADDAEDETSSSASSDSDTTTTSE